MAIRRFRKPKFCRLLYFPAANGCPLGAEETEKPVFLKNKTCNLGLEVILKMREDYESRNHADTETVQKQVDWVQKYFSIEPKKAD